jgi:LysM repeat protein
VRNSTLLTVIPALLLSASFAWAVEYVVKSGDNLSKIAKEQLGDESRWPEIANGNNLKHPYRIKVGQKLELPSAPHQRTGGVQALPGLPEELVPDLKSLIVSILVTLVVLWILGSVCLRMGCWFALVNASFPRCLLLSLGIAILMIICLMLTVLVCAMAIHGGWSRSTPISIAVALWMADIAATILLAKHFLRCKWRSVITVFVMTFFLQVVFVTLVVFCVTVPSLDVLRDAAPFGRLGGVTGVSEPAFS